MDEQIINILNKMLEKIKQQEDKIKELTEYCDGASNRIDELQQLVEISEKRVGGMEEKMVALNKKIDDKLVFL